MELRGPYPCAPILVAGAMVFSSRESIFAAFIKALIRATARDTESTNDSTLTKIFPLIVFILWISSLIFHEIR